MYVCMYVFKNFQSRNVYIKCVLPKTIKSLQKAPSDNMLSIKVSD